MSGPKPSKKGVQFGVSDDAASIKAPSLKSPRIARFAEATAVNSPIEPSEAGRNPFKDPPTKYLVPEPQVADVGFGYINKHESVEMPDTDYQPPLTARTIPKSPLKSAMKTPGAPPRDLHAILSPTFKEEEILDKHENFTEKEQARDIKIKTRVQIAKFMLRGVNFSCSLIVLGMLGSTFAIFNATKTIPPRNDLPPWAENQQTWPQILLLSISCVSLFTCLIIFWGYYKGGHRKAERVAVWYSVYAVCFFIFSILMWALGAAVLQTSKNNGNNKDLWGWSCVDNQRRQLFQNEVGYQLVCRLQNWSLVCAIIEIVVEVITIAVYGVVFHRFYSKRKLRKSMAARDRARSDLYLAQLRSQSQPNTPAPFSPRDGGWRAPSNNSSTEDIYTHGPALEDADVQYIDADKKAQPNTAFKLQAPPIKITGATPKLQQQASFAPQAPPPLTTTLPRTPSPQAEFEQDLRSPFLPREVQQDHFAHVAPGEEVYDAVPIPEAYEAPLSPGFEFAQGQPGQQMFFPPPTMHGR